jgi:hypothetical protein
VPTLGERLTNLNFKIDVPQKLRAFLEYPDAFVDRTMKSADKLALTLLQATIKTNAPRRSGNLSKSITVDLAERKISSNLVYSRAIELGHYAEPRGKFLHFVSGGKDVFLRFTRAKKQPYFFKSINQNKQQVLEIYDEAFKKLLESV